MVDFFGRLLRSGVAIAMMVLVLLEEGQPSQILVWVFSFLGLEIPPELSKLILLLGLMGWLVALWPLSDRKD